MTDSVQIWKPGFRILDDSGDPIAGGKLKFYDAGTSTPRTVYTDKGLSANATTVITADSSGVPQVSSTDVVAYTNTSDYKVNITDASDNVVITIDNLAGALDTSGYLTTATPVNTPTQTKTSAYTVVATDMGNVLNCDATSAAFNITLGDGEAGSGDISTVGNGATLTVRKIDSSVNAVTVVGHSSETIDGLASRGLTAQYQSIQLVSNGSTWDIVADSSSDSEVHEEFTDADYTSVTTTLTHDDSKPLVSEGTEIATLNVTPSSTNAEMMIWFHCQAYTAANKDVVISLFTGASTEAIHSVVVSVDNAKYNSINFVHVHAPGVTTAVTYSVRAALTAAGTVYFNGDNSTRLLGGASSIELLAREI